MIANLSGSYERQKHGAEMLGDSRLLYHLLIHSFTSTGQRLNIMYIQWELTSSPFRRICLRTPKTIAFSNFMGGARLSVECCFSRF